MSSSSRQDGFVVAHSLADRKAAAPFQWALARRALRALPAVEGGAALTADACAMRLIPSNTPNAATTMIGHRAAHMIAEDAP